MISSADRRPLALVSGLTVLLLAPFLGKAFHMDDTVFLWCAEQILRDPLDFYGFMANWSDQQRPMYVINQNPPLISYYIALFAGFLGWSEWVLHTAFLLPAAALASGMYCLSRHFCSSPIYASLAGILTPVFMVSSTNIMAEVMMTALYVWAAAAWLHGMDSRKRGYLLLSAALIVLSAMTKYFGITMTALLFVYTLLQRNRPTGWFFYLIIPVAVAVLYQWLTLTLYGTNLIEQATQYSVALGLSEDSSIFKRALTGLSFLGGCLISSALLAPLLWGARGLTVIAAAVISMFGLFMLAGEELVNLSVTSDSPQKIVLFQFALFVVLGMQILLLAALDLYRARDNKALLLALWLMGTLVFASMINWSTNARTLLPLLPVFGILVVRRLETVGKQAVVSKPIYALPLLVAGLLSLLVALADFSWANNQQHAARLIASELSNYPHRVWFDGHWGFQWYMERYGALPLEKHSPIQPGDLIIKPGNNSNPIPLNVNDFTLVEEKRFPVCCHIRTMSSRSRAGFYSDYWGELPFAVAAPKPDRFAIYLAGRFPSSEEAEEYYRYLSGK